MITYNWPTSGVITHAYWRQSARNRDPYIHLEIETEPFLFGGQEISKLHKSLSLTYPVPIGYPTPIKQLEEALGFELGWGPEFTIKVDSPIPLFIGRRINFRLGQVKFEGVWRLRVEQLLSKEKGGIMVKRLEDVEPGTMFQRPNGTVRYIKSQITRKRTLHIREIYCHCYDGKSEGYWMSEATLVKACDISSLTGIESEEEVPVGDFWMCLVNGGEMPRIRHSMESNARCEAERLARVSKDRVFLLGAMAYVDYTPPGNAETEWTEMDC